MSCSATLAAIGDHGHAPGSRRQYHLVMRLQHRIARGIRLQPARIGHGHRHAPRDGKRTHPLGEPSRRRRAYARQRLQQIALEQALRRDFLRHAPAQAQRIRLRRLRLLEQPVAQPLRRLLRPRPGRWGQSKEKGCTGSRGDWRHEISGGDSPTIRAVSHRGDCNARSAQFTLDVLWVRSETTPDGCPSRYLGRLYER